MSSKYHIDLSYNAEAIYWQSSFNKIESEETFLPITQEPVEYEFFQTREFQNGRALEWWWGQQTTVFK